MLIRIDPVVSGEDQRAISLIREQVFEREMGIAVPRLELSHRNAALHLLARAAPSGQAAAALSIIDTSHDSELHSRHGLVLEAGASVARYTQLAVLRQYRRMNIPIMMMLEAHRLFVQPRRVSYTWLLFDAERASSSFLCRRLAFVPQDTVSQSEYGRTRALVRDEKQPGSIQASIKARQNLEVSVSILAAPQRTRHGAWQAALE